MALSAQEFEKLKAKLGGGTQKTAMSPVAPQTAPVQPAGQFDVPALPSTPIDHKAKLAQLQANVPALQQKSDFLGSFRGQVGGTIAEVGNSLSSSEQALGRSVGAIAGTGQATEQANQSVQADTQMALKFLRTISENDKDGKDTTHLKQVYNQWKQGQPNGSALPELPTTGQVVGQLGGVALDALSFGTYGKGAEGMVTGALASSEPTIATGLKAVASKTAGLFTKEGALAVAKGAGVGYGYDVTQGLQGNRGEDREGAKAFIPGLNTVVGGAIPAVAGFAQSVKNGTPAVKSTVSKSVTGVVDTIDSVGEKIKRPDVTSATAVSLNPKKALAGTGQDIQVSVGGKLKQLSEVTPDEYSKMQMGTQRNMANFTKEAELFKNNRNPVNDPTAIIWKRSEKALKFADKKRQGIGAKMGEIETRHANKQLPIGQKVQNQFAETIKSFDNPTYGVDTQDAKVVQKLVDDFDRLESGGASVGERMKFVRAWDKYLNDSKDSFGKFKENATANTRIQNAVLTLKNETVDAISASDSVYRGLRKEYAVHKKLAEFADSLGGIDGMLGDRVKGGAAVKRAIKSNSDGGARQFFFKLKEITGYDAIKDADIAITAMDNVGDYQGLSLLEVLNDGKAGLVKRGLEGAQNKLVGNQTTRVNKYIQDVSAKQNKISQPIANAIPKGGAMTNSINQSNIPISNNPTTETYISQGIREGKQIGKAVVDYAKNPKMGMSIDDVSKSNPLYAEARKFDNVDDFVKVARHEKSLDGFDGNIKELLNLREELSNSMENASQKLTNHVANKRGSMGLVDDATMKSAEFQKLSLDFDQKKAALKRFMQFNSKNNELQKAMRQYSKNKMMVSRSQLADIYNQAHQSPEALQVATNNATIASNEQILAELAKTNPELARILNMRQ